MGRAGRVATLLSTPAFFFILSFCVGRRERDEASPSQQHISVVCCFFSPPLWNESERAMAISGNPPSVNELMAGCLVTSSYQGLLNLTNLCVFRWFSRSIAAGAGD
jgi:hypothetical protein